MFICLIFFKAGKLIFCMFKRGQARMSWKLEAESWRNFGKRGQLTLFVIIAIVIVVAVGLFFVLRGDAPETEAEDVVVSVEIAPVKNLVESCIETATFDSVYLIGEGGGYIYPPYDLSDIDGYTYYFLDGKTYLPTMREIEGRLADNVEASVLLCVDDFESFNNMRIEDDEMDIKIDVFDNKVVFDVNYPLSIRIGQDSSSLDDFGKFEVEARLGKVYSVVEDLIQEGVYDDGMVCLSCFMDAGYENNLTIDFLDGRDYGSVFVIKDFAIPIDNATTENYYNVDVSKFSEDKTFKWIFASD
jgi:hypothetical protein